MSGRHRPEWLLGFILLLMGSGDRLACQERVRVQKFIVNAGSEKEPFLENAYIVFASPGGEAFIVDPGAVDERIERFVRTEGLNVVKILNTHGHADHVGGNRYYADLFRVPIAAHRNDLSLYPEGNASGRPDEFLSDGGLIPLGPLRLRVIHTPGHSPGSLCFLVEDKLLSGDTLFAGSIGKAFGTGKGEKAKWLEKEIRSIQKKLLVLPITTWVFSGHGRTTTLDDEIQNNPFLKFLK